LAYWAYSLPPVNPRDQCAVFEAIESRDEAQAILYG
jgi:hypothetical protein